MKKSLIAALIAAAVVLTGCKIPEDGSAKAYELAADIMGINLEAMGFFFNKKNNGKLSGFNIWSPYSRMGSSGSRWSV